MIFHEISCIFDINNYLDQEFDSGVQLACAYKITEGSEGYPCDLALSVQIRSDPRKGTLAILCFLFVFKPRLPTHFCLDRLRQEGSSDLTPPARLPIHCSWFGGVTTPARASPFGH